MLPGVLRDWFRRRRLERRARKLLEAAFGTPELLRGTSLKPRHASRWVLLRHEAQGDKVTRIWFGILRHPRPYAFSRQFHRVVEHYLYDVEGQRIERLRGTNITRAEGLDA